MNLVRGNQRVSPARTNLLRSIFRRPSCVVVKGVHLPPKGILFMDSSPKAGLKHGISHVNKLARHGLNVDTGTILDVGCGWGRLAYGLLDRGFQGRYIGIDVIKSRLVWLNRHFSEKHPSYTFHFADVRNEWYNPRGTKSRIDFRAALDGQSPDTIVLMSVFTHMYEANIADYLSDISGLMSDKSVLIFSCFLFDGPAEKSIVANGTKRAFAHKLSNDCRCDSLSNPLSAIAYTEPAIMRFLSNANLIGKVIRGSWAGDKTDHTFHQDMVIAHV